MCPLTRPSAGRSRATRSNGTGFTLIEILIVVVILGVLAAIVIPQFASASDDARRNNMRTQLQNLRTYAELYRVQHRDQAPPTIDGDNWDALVYCSASDHTIKSGDPRNVPDDTYKLGPYMPTPPVNPLTNSSVVTAFGTAGTSGTGWYFDGVTGQFYGANKAGDLSDTGQ